MQIIRFSLASVSLMMWTGCAGFSFFHRASQETEAQGVPPPSDIQSPAQVQLEAQKIQYDGQELSARLLVGVSGGSIILDKRLIENTVVSVDSVTRCDTEQPLEFLEADRFPAPAQDKELLVLQPGYWYGAEVRFPLFDPKLNGQSGPECIEATLRFQAHGSKAASVSARIRVSQSASGAVRSDPRPGEGNLAARASEPQAP